MTSPSEAPSHERQVCVRCIVAGHVQGVFFRASAREEALQLGLSGSARNLPDGTVEVVACGEAESINRLRDWLRRGPPQAQVTGVACESIEHLPMQGFSTG
jgi:acylphosphatase